MGGLSRHPFIVTVLASAFTSDYRPCIVMDLFERGNYMELLRRDGPLPLEELLSLSVRVAGALATAHQDGVIHGDVKPQNIFKSAFGYPALGDFGIATLRSRLVDSAGLGLSPHYAAPELIEIGAGAVGAATDQYSLGATIYTLATGRRPFESPHHEAPQQVLARALDAPTPTLPASFPRDLTSVLRRAMAREPQDRFPDLTAFAVALANIEHRLGHRPTAIPIASIDDDATITVDQDTLAALRQQTTGPTTDPTPPPDAPTIALTPPQQPPDTPPPHQPPPQPRRRRILIATLTLLLAAAATTTALLATRQQNDTTTTTQPPTTTNATQAASPQTTEAIDDDSTTAPPPPTDEPPPPQPQPQPPTETPARDEAAAPEPAPAPAAGEAHEGSVKLGFLAGLSGDYAEWGPPSRDGAETAIGVINASGGILGRDAELVVQDNLSTAEGAVAGYNRIREEIDALGGVESGAAVALLGTVAEDQMPTMCPACGTTVLDTEGGNYIWRITASDTTYGIISAQLARDAGYTNVNMLVQQTEGTESPAEVFKDVWENKIGGSIGEDVRFNPGLDSYQAQVEQAFAGNPDAVYIGAGPQAGIPILREYISRGYTAAILVSPDLQVPDIAEVAAELPTGRILAARVTDDFQSPAYAAFATAHQQYAGKAPPTGFYETNQFDQYIVLALAMTAAESTDGPDVAAQIYSIVNAPGTKVYTYADGVAALERGDAIDYDGPSSSLELNRLGNLISPKVAVNHIVSGRYTEREVIELDASLGTAPTTSTALTTAGGTAEHAAEKPVAEPYRAVILYPGFSDDQSWANAWWDGAIQAMDNWPHVQVESVEYAYEVDDYLQNGLSFANEGFDLIIMAHGVMSDPAAQVAEANPGTQVCVAPVQPTQDLLDASPPNLCFIDMAQHHANFFTGALAALVTETGHIGALGGFPFPALTSQPESFHLGARCVNPDIEFSQRYIFTWEDTGIAKTAAQALIADGVDVIQSATDQAVLGIIEAADDADSQVWVIPAYYDSYEINPDVVLTSAIHGLTDVAREMVGRGARGEIEPGSFHDFTAYNTPGISAAPLRGPGAAALSDEGRAIFEDLEERVRSGAIQIPDETEGDNPIGLEEGLGGKIDLASIGC